MPKCVDCGATFPNLIRADGKKRNLCNRKRCLDCSPFRRGAKIEHLTSRVFYDACVLCGKKGRHRLCRACRTRIRRYRAKRAAVDFLGGKCRDCGLTDDDLSVFDCHHTKDKKFRISASSNKSWRTLKRELKKCILLCSICHRRRHSTMNDPKLIEEALKYNGTDYR